MIRNRAFYQPVAKLFTRLSDILFNHIENNNLKLKKWDEVLDPELSHCDKLQDICDQIHSKFAQEFKTLSLDEYKGQAYIKQLTDRLEERHEKALIRYFSSGEIIEKAEKYLGFKPKIKKVMVYANLPGSAKEKEIGSKAFHRDALCHRVYEVFFAVTSVTDENGPFYFVVNSELQNRSEVLIPKNMKQNDWATTGRLSETELESCVDGKLNIGKFVGEAGSYVSLNTGVTYHRGGHVTKGYRIVGRIIFGGEEYKNTEQLGKMKNAFLKILKRTEYSMGRYFREL